MSNIYYIDVSDDIFPDIKFKANMRHRTDKMRQLMNANFTDNGRKFIITNVDNVMYANETVKIDAVEVET